MAKKKELESSVKSYQQGIDLEKQKMNLYIKKTGTSVRSLQEEFRKHSKEMKGAAKNMLEEGSKNMNAKVGRFRGEIKNQIKENKEAAAHMESGVRFFLGEINKKKKDFQAYAQGPLTDYIRAFWG